MLIKNLSLKDFRNFRLRRTEFSENTTVILGDNATGKSNILEALYLLSTGKSFKARVEREMINYTSDIARIEGTVVQPDGTSLKLEVVLTKGEINLHGGGIQKAQKKKLLINGVAKRLVDFAGVIKTVLFGPWDLDLVTESPSIRRQFLDGVLSQTDREYRRSVMIYEKGLRQRNRLLLRIRDEGVSRSQLIYWDKLLIKHGEYITIKRGEFIDYVNATPDYLDRDYSLLYDSSVISEGRLSQYEEEEIAAATTLVGPHRDDLIFNISGNQKKSVNLASFGSRGEQRMGVLWLKLAELSFIETSTGEKPILLLDDIFSELDHEHRGTVIDLCKKQQTIITTADPHYIEKIKGAEIVEIE